MGMDENLHSGEAPTIRGNNNDSVRFTTVTIGFALYWVWIWVMNRSPLLTIVDSSACLGPFGYCAASTAAMSAALLALLPFCSKRGFAQPLMIAVAASGTLGMALLGPLTFFFNELSTASVQMLGWILAGAGSGGCVVLWASHLFAMPSNNKRLGELVASAFAAAVIFLVSTFFELGFFVIVVTLIPAASVLLFAPQERCFDCVRTDRAALPPRACLTIGRICGSLLIFGVAFGLVLAVALQGSDFLLINRISFVAVAVVFLAIILVAMFRPVHNLFLLYRLAAPVVIIGFALLTLAALPGKLLLPSVVISVGWRLFEVIIFLVMIDVIERLNMVSLSSFALGRFMMVFGILIGQSLAYCISGGAPASQSTLIYISAISVVVLSIVNIIFLDLESFRRAELFYNGRSNGGEEAEEELPYDTLEARCAKVAEQYDLTPREAEVFVLLARGRDAKYIEDVLFISNSTVKAHRHNIYRKLDVHSRQELLNIIEED